MLNAIIIEDEKPAVEMLTQLLSEMQIPVNIKAKLYSVKEGIEYLEKKPDADIIFSDVRLSDGLSFDIFSQAGVHIPVIFITGYDNYLMMAFENNGIDYLMKPLNKPDLHKALLKFNKLQTHFSHLNGNGSLEKLDRFIHERRKTRMLVKKGLENIALLMEHIALIYTQNKVVFVIDKCSKKYICDKTLTELEEELDRTYFFRVNRQYIININFVKSFKTYEKVKLQVDMAVPDINHSIIISQETAPLFRRWMQDA